MYKVFARGRKEWGTDYLKGREGSFPKEKVQTQKAIDLRCISIYKHFSKRPTHESIQ